MRTAGAYTGQLVKTGTDAKVINSPLPGRKENTTMGSVICKVSAYQLGDKTVGRIVGLKTLGDA